MQPYPPPFTEEKSQLLVLLTWDPIGCVLPVLVLISGQATLDFLMNSQKAGINYKQPAQLLTGLYIATPYCSVPTLLSEVHYLSCTYFICLFIYSGPSPLPPLSSSAKLSVWMQGELGERWENWEKLDLKMKKSVRPIRLHLTCVPECLLHMFQCMFVSHSCTWISIIACQSNFFFQLHLQKNKDILSPMHEYKKKAHCSLPQKPNSYPALSVITGYIHVRPSIWKDCSSLRAERRAERQIILAERGRDESQVLSALSRDLRSRPQSPSTTQKKKGDWKKVKATRHTECFHVLYCLLGQYFTPKL